MFASEARLRYKKRVNPGTTANRCRGSRRTCARGFSLIELMVVMCVGALLYFSVVGGGKGSRARQQIAQCEGNLHSAFAALQTYAIASGGAFPSIPSARTSEAALGVLVPKCTTSPGDFICPGSGDPALAQGEALAGHKISYAYYMGQRSSDGPDQPLLSDRQVDENPKPFGAPLFSSDGKKPGNNHGKYGGNILFCDGSIKTSPAASAFNLTNGPGVVLLNPKP